MHSSLLLGVAVGEGFEDHDVRDERAASVEAFEEVVGEDPLLGHAVRKAALEGLDVDQPLAGEDSFAEQVLVDVGDGAGVDVDAGVARLQSAVEGGGAAGGGLDARLEDGVARHDLARSGVVHRPVERVGRGAHEPRHRAERQACVGIGDHGEAAPPEVGQRANAHGEGVERAVAHQAAEVLDLAALALPTQEGALRGAPAAPAVQQVERPVLVTPAVAAVEGADGFDERGLDRGVFGPLRRGRVGEIGQEDDADPWVAVGQVMGFEGSGQRRGVVGRVHEDGYDHGCLAPFRQAATEVEARQEPRADEVGEKPVDKRQAHKAGRHQRDRKPHHP